jgi:glycerol-3-phosphate dehydrogenase
MAGDEGGPLLQPTKGVHLVAPAWGLEVGLLLLHPADGRVFFVLPWLGKTLVGTTDTEYTGPPDEVAVTEEDIAYLLEGFNRHLEPSLGRGDVLSAFAGLRPLVHSVPGEPSARSREHRLSWSPNGLLTVAGGKYTTYRRMAELVTDEALRRLGQRRRCRTASYRLDGAPAEEWETFAPAAVASLRAHFHLDEATAHHLVGRYGRRARDVAGYLERRPELARPVVEGEPDLWAELAYQRDREMAVEAEDFLLRRTRLGLFRPELLRQPLAWPGQRENASGP